MPFDPNKPYTVVYEPPAPSGDVPESTAGGIKAFDPSRPYTVVYDPPKFDPNKPYAKVNEDGSHEWGDPEYDTFKRRYQKNQQEGALVKAADYVGGLVEGGFGMAGTAAKALGETVLHPLETAKRIGPTMIEGAAQGTAGLANIGGMLGARAGELYMDHGASEEDKIRHAYVRSKESPLIDYGPNKPLVPVIGKEAMPAQAEALGMVLDPITIASMGAGALPEAGLKSYLRGGVAKAGEVIGKGVEQAGRAAQMAYDLPVGFAREALQKFGANETQRQAVEGSAFVAGLASHNPIAAGLTSAKTAGAVAESAGRGTSELSQAVGQGPSQLSALETVAKNPNAPGYVRQIASMMTVNPAMTKMWGMAGNAAKGAATGAALGTGLGIVSGEDAEKVGEMAGSGAALGVGGYALGKALSVGNRNLEAKKFDRVRFIAEQAEKGNDVSKLNPDVLDKMVEARLIFGDQVDIQVADADKYKMLDGPGSDGSSNAFFQGSERPGSQHLLAIQKDAAFNPSIFLEEVGHGIYKADPTNRAQIQDTLRAVYGDDYINDFEKDYAKKHLSSQGNHSPTSAEVDQQIDINRQSGGQDVRFNELFARDFVNTTLDQSLLKMRNMGKLPEQGSDPLIKRKLGIALKGSFLQKAFGIDPGEIKATSQIPSSVDPAIRNLIVNYLKDVDRYKKGLDQLPVADKYEGAPVRTSKLIDHPAFRKSYNLDPETGRYQNDFSYLVMKDGGVLPADLSIDQVDQLIDKKLVKFQPRPIDEIKKLENARLQEAVIAFSRRRSAYDPEIGIKPDFKDSSKTVIRGEKLPQEFMQLRTFSPSTKMFAKAMEESIPTGNTFSVWYQRAGTGKDEGSWAKSVKKGLGNIRAAQYEVKPIGFTVSKAGNLLVTAEDVGMRNRTFQQWFKEGRLKRLWGDNFEQFQNDYNQWIHNHSEGNPGETGISDGIRKKNVFRAITGSTNKLNPLEDVPEVRESFNKKELRGFYKSFRVDRVQGLTPTGTANNWVNYDLRLKNYNRSPMPVKNQ
jgi:hypothetical protein